MSILRTKLNTAKLIDDSIFNAASLPRFTTPQAPPNTPTTSVSASIAETQSLIQDTLLSTAKVLKKNKGALSASETLEKRWADFQEAFQKMNNAMIDNIAASLGKEPALTGAVTTLTTFYEHSATSVPQVVEFIAAATNIVILTGAGVSVSSGIPTYRGSDGTWTMGSKNYTPQEIATWDMYSKETMQCWNYFTDRSNMCAKAEPNLSHTALVELENYCKTKDKHMTLVSQNIDNLHFRAGSTHLLEIHGNMKYVRCSNPECSECNALIQRNKVTHCRTDEMEGEQDGSPQVPVCTTCQQPLRPHVLFFDESYSEELYKSASVQAAVSECDLLIVIGTMCTTSLPNRILATCGRRKIPIIDINPNPNQEIHCAPLLQLVAKSDIALPRIMAMLKKKRVDNKL